MRPHRDAVRSSARRWPLLALVLLAGCGSLKSQSATEQLLMSDAVDRAVAKIDFGAMSNEKVYLDTQHLKSIKGAGFVNADYIISSLRQQMVASRCLLQDKAEEADVIVEARVGALGSDANEVIYGIPASSALSSAAALMPSVPALPAIPEISLGKKSYQRGAAKIGLFAYDRRTKQPIWQSGTSQSQSNATDIWVLGAGPFQRGTIFNRPLFAGSELHLPLLANPDREEQDRLASYSAEVLYRRNEAPKPGEPNSTRVKVAGYEQQEAGEARSERPPSGAGGDSKTPPSKPKTGKPRSNRRPKELAPAPDEPPQPPAPPAGDEG